MSNEELDLKILTHIFGDITFGLKYNSPFREDPGPSVVLYDNEGESDADFRYSFWDFGHRVKDTSILNLLRLVLSHQKKRKVSLKEAHSYAVGELNDLVIESPSRIKRIVSREPEIELHPYLETWELDYWHMFGQTTDILDREKCSAVKSFGYGGQVWESKEGDPIFHWDLMDGCWKIYRPYAPEKKDKFRSGGQLVYCIEGFDTLPDEMDLFFANAGRKDTLVHKLTFEGSANASSEGSFNAWLKYKDEIERRSGKQYILFDPDKQGIKYAKQAKEKLKWEPIILSSILDYHNPKMNRPCKDISEIQENYDLDLLHKIYKKHKIL